MSWYRLVQIGTGWYRLEQVGSSWYRLAQVGTGWYRLVQVGMTKIVLRLGPGPLQKITGNLELEIDVKVSIYLQR